MRKPQRMRNIKERLIWVLVCMPLMPLNAEPIASYYLNSRFPVVTEGVWLTPYLNHCQSMRFSTETSRQEGTTLYLDFYYENGPLVAACPPVPQYPINLADYFNLQAGQYSVVIEEFTNGFEPANLGNTEIDFDNPVGEASFDFTIAPGRVRIKPAYSGHWYNPDQPGHGFDILVGDDGTLGVTWYTFAANGSRLWLVGHGEYGAQSATINLYRSVGGRFPPDFDPGQINVEPWGQLELVVDSCDAIQASWAPNSGTGLSPGGMQLKRLYKVGGQPCWDNTIDSTANQLQTFTLPPSANSGNVRRPKFLESGVNGQGDAPSVWDGSWRNLPSELGTGKALYFSRPAVQEGQHRLHLLSTLHIGSGRNRDVDAQGPELLAAALEVTVAVPQGYSCEESDHEEIRVSARLLNDRLRLLRGEFGVVEQVRGKSNSSDMLGDLTAPLITDGSTSTDTWLVKSFRTTFDDQLLDISEHSGLEWNINLEARNFFDCAFEFWLTDVRWETQRIDLKTNNVLMASPD